MAVKPKYYWDACAWIGLIRQEPGRVDALRYVMEQAQRGEVEIWTSAFTLAEVFKRKCDGELKGIETAQDQAFEDYLQQEHVILAQVDMDVGKLARRLLRQYPKIGKPQDAVHVATALRHGCDELHTFDRDDLLVLTGQIERADGSKLKICNPPSPPPPPVPENDLFTPQREANGGKGERDGSGPEVPQDRAQSGNRPN